MVEHIFRKKGGRGWIYTEEASEALAEMYRVNGTWKNVARRIGVSVGNLSVYVTKLRQMGFIPGGPRDLETVRNREVGAEGYKPQPDEEPSIMLEIRDPSLAETELVTLQRQRIDYLEMILGNIKKLITEILN